MQREHAAWTGTATGGRATTALLRYVLDREASMRENLLPAVSGHCHQGQVDAMAD